MPARRHGLYKTKVYAAWVAMRQRCYNPHNPMFERYGAKGIKVCDRWRLSFENFLADIKFPPTKGHSLDRWPNEFGDYEPDNCRWATRIDQARNKRKPKNRKTVRARSSRIGVSWAAANRKWTATIGVNRKTIYLGVFSNECDAIAARIAAEEKYWPDEVSAKRAVKP